MGIETAIIGAAVGSAVGAGAGAAASSSERGKSRDARRRAESLTARYEDFAKKQLDIIEDLGFPAQQQFLQQASGALPPNYYASRAAQDVRQAFSNQQQQYQRDLSRMGVDASSPRYAALLNEVGLARAAAEAGARTQARQAAENITFARRMNAADFSLRGGQQGQSGLQNASNFYSNLAASHGANAAGIMQGFTQLGGSLGGAIGGAIGGGGPSISNFSTAAGSAQAGVPPPVLNPNATTASSPSSWGNWLRSGGFGR